MAVLALAPGAGAQTVAQLKTLSIEQLANIEVTSVSKTSEPLSDAAAAVSVELNTWIGWAVEAGASDEVPRSFLVDARLRF